MSQLTDVRRGGSFLRLLARVLTHRGTRLTAFERAIRTLRVQHGKPLPLSWESRPIAPDTLTLRRMSKYPHAIEWIVSDDFCVAPDQWPSSMVGAFRHGLIPSPLEYGRLHLYRHVPYDGGTDQVFFDYVRLKLYCYGMPIPLIAAHFEVEESFVHASLFRCMQRMFDISAFVVWATATDFHRTKILPQMWHACRDKSPRGRGKFLRLLQKDLFILGTKVLDPWIKSPLILSYLIYATPKQPRNGIYPCDERLGGTFK